MTRAALRGVVLATIGIVVAGMLAPTDGTSTPTATPSARRGRRSVTAPRQAR